MEIITEIRENIIDGNAPRTQSLVQQALDQGLAPANILHDGLIPAMAEVGARFERNEFYVPEMLLAARAMKGGLSLLKPRLLESKIEPVGKVVLATVKGDLHDIGKNLVGIMLEGAGFQVIDLGVDAPPEKFVAIVQDQQPDILAMSALLTTTMLSMQLTIEALKAAGLRDLVKVMIGGAPVTQKYADEIGADVYAPDASAAANAAKSLLSK
jgi:5-methyltetrahydrofolate--homocysteine methyltransferase